MLRLNCSRYGLKIKFVSIKSLVCCWLFSFIIFGIASILNLDFSAFSSQKLAINFFNTLRNGCLCRVGLYDDKVGGRFHFLSTHGVILFTLAIEVRHAVEALKLDRWLVAKFCRVQLFRVDSFLTGGDASRCIDFVSFRTTMLISPIQEY